MKHIVALLIKYTAISAVLLMILGISQDISLPRILLISLIITGSAYLIGDLFVLPKYGNMVATIADFGLSFLGIWLLTYLLTDNDYTGNIGAPSFWAALLISVIEVFFHIYIKKVVLHGDNDSRESTNIHHDRYAMEISHEYLNRSEIEKVRSIQKENDTKNKMK
ncbi:YndM family protein [Bacillus sp. Xin]|uniref:YndM family protein n=1 Tax=unclassified Bacillus (in: firmicutes) TaxID=185979 RepID=UPI00157398AC|nr:MULTISPECIES: YndM family protein [unclassified Bacillus (in: firmicutes)]MBC6972797.1 YndM family protein [Bacillus sp. Xin]NSW37254.1 YndM family protein [Bacillus sp. Xin1]